LHEFRERPLFDSSMMVHFRKRFPADKIEEINKGIFARSKKDEDDDDPPANKGKLVLDATCAPSDIRYPSDLSLLNEARENTEKIIDELWEYGPRRGRKTRYIRKRGGSQYLSVAKQKKVSRKRIRGAIGRQLEYIRRNLVTIGDLLLYTGLDVLAMKRIERLVTICELYRQQSEMYLENSRSCENRIVSLRQPHVRPIVRGKAGKRFEFGQKIALSVVDGYTFIERQSFDNFHEGISLIESAEGYRDLHGCYPEVIQADKIYRNRGNLAYCKEKGIRLSGPRLGRPSKDAPRDREIESQDNRERIIIEGRIGNSKRRFGLDLIMAYLPETALTEAALNILCMNARIRLLLLRLFKYWFQRFSIPWLPQIA